MSDQNIVVNQPPAVNVQVGQQPATAVQVTSGGYATSARQDEQTALLEALVELGFPIGPVVTAVTDAATVAHTDALAIIAAVGQTQDDALTDAELRAAPVPVTGPLTDAQLRATQVDVALRSGAGTALSWGSDNGDATAASGTNDKPRIVTRTTLYDADANVWVRARGSTANGLDVDVTRVQGEVAVTGPLTDAQLRATAVPVSISASTVNPGTAATNLGKAEDAAHASGDTGVAVWAVRNDNLATTFVSANGDYSPIAVDGNGRVAVRLLGSASATDIMKAEDAPHASGDHGVSMLAVRNDSATSLVDAAGDYAPLQVDATGGLRVSMAATVGVGYAAPGSTNLAKAEDAPASSGDHGVAMLGRRMDSVFPTTDAEGDYTLLSLDNAGRLRVIGPATDAELRATPLPVDTGYPETETGALLVGNARTKYRDEFATGTNQPDPANWFIEDEDPDTGQTGQGNIITMGGDAYGARYVRLSLSPFIDDSRMVLTSRAKFKVPTRIMFGVSQSQRVVGTEMFFGLVEASDTDAIGVNRSTIPAPPDRAITANATVTSNTATFTVPGHGFTTGDRVIIYGCGDTRFNLGPITVSVSNADNIVAAITIANGTYTTAGGFVREADPLTRAHNGFGHLWENSATANASLVVRRNGQSYRIRNSGVGSSISTPVSTSAWQDSLLPTAVNELMLTVDEAGYRSWAVDTNGGMSGMDKFMSTIPDEGVDYRIHFRARNLEGLSKPIAKIVSAAKSGSTTATITTDRPHGLTTGSRVAIYGIRDTANFASTSDAAVASVPSATTFTVVFGASATATTTDGGVVWVNHGSVSAPGAINLNVQSVSRDTYGQVTVTMHTTASGYTPGELVNLWGLNAAAAAFEGVYRVNVGTGNEARLIPLYNVVTGSPISAINTGGMTIRRSEMRIQYVRVLDFTRHAVEVIGGRGHGTDSNNAVAITSVGGNMNMATLPPYTNETFETNTNLSANALYSGATRDVTSDATRVMSHLRVLVRHLAGVAHGTLYVEQSIDATTWFETFRQPVPSDGLYHTFELALFSRYYRLRFQNGATAQTAFYLHARRAGMGGTVASEIDRVLTFPMSVTALAAAATFTGPTLDLGGNHAWEELRASVYADVGGTLFVEESRDGTTWRSVDAGVAVAASGPQYLVVERKITQRYERVRYVNGGTLQAAFALDVTLSTN